jgi:hypothetical protein
VASGTQMLTKGGQTSKATRGLILRKYPLWFTTIVNPFIRREQIEQTKPGAKEGKQKREKIFEGNYKPN